MDFDANSAVSEESSAKIRCCDVPEIFFQDKTLAKQYFRQFGQIKRMIFKKRYRACTLEYCDNDGFLNALNNAGEYNGVFFEVTVDTGAKFVKKPQKNPDPDWQDDPEVKAELEVMGGAVEVRKQYNLRPEKMSVDPVEQLKPEKIPKPLKRSWKSTDVPKLMKKKKPTDLYSSDQLDLINLVKQQATTVEEKYRMLDARDKLIRIRLKRNAELKSTATVGTCPDMCPEKERLMRETQHQVALYEQEDGGRGMNPSLAVKQYSRSSADQEAPLSHELRPVSVLNMTMGYLMHQIMDMCENPEVNLGEWYHFLWDRMRGIRKDITQQEMCCQGSVELVEQCARFHIHCSARLVAEDPSVFDQKINTENLTKCLQTLKYMYHDLQLKGESCPHEAEFRAYIILLNLHDGNFMWEVQQLRPEIQKSAQIKFALDVYSALDKNNYVKFFKLVYSTSYLNACLLMRYFVQVRTVALQTFAKCYSPPSVRPSRSLLPLLELTRILAFEDEEACIDFVETHNLLVNPEKTHVVLYKIRFILPEYPYVLDRAINVVESKKNCCTGEVVCGDKLPPKLFLNHQPQNSFDSNGYLLINDYLNQSDLEVPKPSVVSEPIKIDLTKDEIKVEEKPVKSNFKSPVVSENLFTRKTITTPVGLGQKALIDKPFKESPMTFGQKPNDEIDASTSKPIWSFAGNETTNSNIFAPPKLQNTFNQPITESRNIFGATVREPVVQKDLPKKGGFSFDLKTPTIAKIPSLSQPLPELTLPVMKMPISPEAIRREDSDQRRREELEKQQKVEAEQKLLQQIEEQKRVVELKKQQLLEAKLKKLQEIEEQEEKRKKLLADLKKERDQANQRKKELELKQAVLAVVGNLLDVVEVKVCKEKLGEIQKRIQNRRLVEMVDKWRSLVAKNKRKRKAMDCSPVWVSSKTLQQEAKDLHTISQDFTLKYMKRYKRGVSYDIPTFELEQIRNINLYQLTYSSLVKRFFDLNCRLAKNIFWKVTVSLPDSKEMTNGLNRIEETLQNGLQWEDRNGETVLVEQIKPNAAQSVTYCVTKQSGFNVKDNDSNGIIFIAEDFNANLQKRILENLKNFGVFVKVPIVIILQNCDGSQAKLKTLIDQKIVSDYVILIDNFSPQVFLSLFEEGLIFLSSKVEKPPPLELDTLQSFLTKYLCTEIWKRAASFTKWNSNYKTCLRNPNTVIKLYNEGLEKLQQLIFNENCLEHAHFPEIFKTFLSSEIPDYLPCNYRYFPKFWRQTSYLERLRKILEGLKLPQWREKWPATSEFELEVNISKFCTNIFKKPEKPFYKIMSVLLKNVDPNVNFENIANVVWTDVIEVLALEKVNEVNFSLSGTEFANKSVFNQYVVIYDVNTLEEYNKSDWFYINNPLIKKQVKKLAQASAKKSVEPTVQLDLNLSIDLDKTLAEVTNQLQNTENISTMKRELQEFNLLMSDLESSIKVHKKISHRFEDTLKQVIDEK